MTAVVARRIGGLHFRLAGVPDEALQRQPTDGKPSGRLAPTFSPGGRGRGVIYFSDSLASSDDTVKLPGFVRFDAGIYANIDKNWRAQLTSENIFNKGYWASADGNNNISPGQGRTIRLQAADKL